MIQNMNTMSVKLLVNFRMFIVLVKRVKICKANPNITGFHVSSNFTHSYDVTIHIIKKVFFSTISH